MAGRAGRFFNRDGTNRTERVGLKRMPISDLHHWVLQARWGIFMSLIVALYVAGNTVFALLYMADGGVENARTFLDHFFFSVHTMMTIGYGTLAPRSIGANLLVAVEALLGLIGFATATGLFFNKLARPTARVLFSEVAVVTVHDGALTLMFRMANERSNQVVEAALHVVLAREERTKEGQSFRRFYDLPLVRDRSAIFALSWTAMHVVDARSVLYGQTVESLLAQRVEIVASLVGLDETSSQTIHARHSWSADELRYGHRFVDILERTPDGRARIDYRRFQETTPDGITTVG